MKSKTSKHLPVTEYIGRRGCWRPITSGIIDERDPAYRSKAEVRRNEKERRSNGLAPRRIVFR